MKPDRGDLKGYLVTTIIVLVGVAIFSHIYSILDGFMYYSIWGSRDNFYLNSYRSSSPAIWRFLHMINTNNLWYVLPAVWMIFIYMVQFRLTHLVAKKVIIYNSVGVVLLLGIMFVGFSYNLVGPIGAGFWPDENWHKTSEAWFEGLKKP